MTKIQDQDHSFGSGSKLAKRKERRCRESWRGLDEGTCIVDDYTMAASEIKCNTDKGKREPLLTENEILYAHIWLAVGRKGKTFSLSLSLYHVLAIYLMLPLRISQFQSPLISLPAAAIRSD